MILSLFFFEWDFSIFNVSVERVSQVPTVKERCRFLTVFPESVSLRRKPTASVLGESSLLSGVGRRAQMSASSRQ